MAEGEKSMIEVGLVIKKDGEDFIGFNVLMPEVPRVGDAIALDAFASEPTTHQNETDHLEKYQGHWNCKVKSVTWRVGHSLDKGDENNSFQNVLVDCELV